MKNLKFISLILAIAFLIIGFVLMFNSKKEMEEDRSYKTTKEVPGNTFDTINTLSDFNSLAIQIGFENPKCTDDINTGGKYCYAEHEGYSNFDLTDGIGATYDKSNTLFSFTTTLYFSVADFTKDKILDISNKIIKNFFGTDLDNNNVATVMEELKADMNSETPVAQESFQTGDYTYQINMQYNKEKKFYVMRYYVSLTSNYHLG